jgi:hypothetical protein
MELIPLIDWNNAQSGFGFMEFGYTTDDTGTRWPFALNFDVLAHELGHAILFATLDLPLDGQWTAQFGAFHESSADLTAIISTMHFDSVLERLMRSTRGNIYTLNELNRIGEISNNRQIRLASNTRKMSEVTDEVHDLSRPLTGAIFDAIVYLYVEELRAANLIDAALYEMVLDDDARARNAGRMQAAFDRVYQNRHFQFKAALTTARDSVGMRLTQAWSALSPDDLTYGDVADAFLAADARQTGDRHQEELRRIFDWREISTS